MKVTLRSVLNSYKRLIEFRSGLARNCCPHSGRLREWRKRGEDQRTGLRRAWGGGFDTMMFVLATTGSKCSWFLAISVLKGITNKLRLQSSEITNALYN